MPEGLANLWKKIKDYWNDLDKGQKTRLFVTVGIIAAAIAVTLFFVLKTDYVPLLESGSEYDLKAIVEYLDSKDIKYKKGTNQIYVDSRMNRTLSLTWQVRLESSVLTLFLIRAGPNCHLPLPRKIRKNYGSSLNRTILCINSKNLKT